MIREKLRGKLKIKQKKSNAKSNTSALAVFKICENLLEDNRAQYFLDNGIKLYGNFSNFGTVDIKNYNLFEQELKNYEHYVQKFAFYMSRNFYHLNRIVKENDGDRIFCQDRLLLIWEIERKIFDLLNKFIKEPFFKEIKKENIFDLLSVNELLHLILTQFFQMVPNAKEVKAFCGKIQGNLFLQKILVNELKDQAQITYVSFRFNILETRIINRHKEMNYTPKKLQEHFETKINEINRDILFKILILPNIDIFINPYNGMKDISEEKYEKDILSIFVLNINPLLAIPHINFYLKQKFCSFPKLKDMSIENISILFDRAKEFLLIIAKFLDTKKLLDNAEEEFLKIYGPFLNIDLIVMYMLTLCQCVYYNLVLAEYYITSLKDPLLDFENKFRSQKRNLRDICNHLSGFLFKRRYKYIPRIVGLNLISKEIEINDNFDSNFYELSKPNGKKCVLVRGAPIKCFLEDLDMLVMSDYEKTKLNGYKLLELDDQDVFDSAHKNFYDLMSSEFKENKKNQIVPAPLKKKSFPKSKKEKCLLERKEEIKLHQPDSQTLQLQLAKKQFSDFVQRQAVDEVMKLMKTLCLNKENIELLLDAHNFVGDFFYEIACRKKNDLLNPDSIKWFALALMYKKDLLSFRILDCERYEAQLSVTKSQIKKIIDYLDNLERERKLECTYINDQLKDLADSRARAKKRLGKRWYRNIPYGSISQKTKYKNNLIERKAFLEDMADDIDYSNKVINFIKTNKMINLNQFFQSALPIEEKKGAPKLDDALKLVPLKSDTPITVFPDSKWRPLTQINEIINKRLTYIFSYILPPIPRKFYYDLNKFALESNISHFYLVGRFVRFLVNDIVSNSNPRPAYDYDFGITKPDAKLIQQFEQFLFSGWDVFTPGLPDLYVVNLTPGLQNNNRITADVFLKSENILENIDALCNSLRLSIDFKDENTINEISIFYPSDLFENEDKVRKHFINHILKIPVPASLHFAGEGYIRPLRLVRLYCIEDWKIEDKLLAEMKSFGKNFNFRNSELTFGQQFNRFSRISSELRKIAKFKDAQVFFSNFCRNANWLMHLFPNFSAEQACFGHFKNIMKKHNHFQLNFLYQIYQMGFKVAAINGRISFKSRLSPLSENDLLYFINLLDICNLMKHRYPEITDLKEFLSSEKFPPLKDVQFEYFWTKSIRIWSKLWRSKYTNKIFEVLIDSGFLNIVFPGAGDISVKYNYFSLIKKSFIDSLNIKPEKKLSHNLLTVFLVGELLYQGFSFDENHTQTNRNFLMKLYDQRYKLLVKEMTDDEINHLILLTKQILTDFKESPVECVRSQKTLTPPEEIKILDRGSRDYWSYVFHRKLILAPSPYLEYFLNEHSIEPLLNQTAKRVLVLGGYTQCLRLQKWSASGWETILYNYLKIAFNGATYLGMVVQREIDLNELNLTKSQLKYRKQLIQDLETPINIIAVDIFRCLEYKVINSLMTTILDNMKENSVLVLKDEAVCEDKSSEDSVKGNRINYLTSFFASRKDIKVLQGEARFFCKEISRYQEYEKDYQYYVIKKF